MKLEEYVAKFYGNNAISKDDIRRILILVKFGLPNGLEWASPKAIRDYVDIMKKIRIRVDRLCRKRPQLRGKTEFQILGIGNVCPNCGSRQFSISVPDIRPADWPVNILGSADCEGCYEDFLVKLAPELEIALWEIMKKYDTCTINYLFQDLFRP